MMALFAALFGDTLDKGINISGGTVTTVVIILVIIVLILLAIYLFRRTRR